MPDYQHDDEDESDRSQVMQAVLDDGRALEKVGPRYQDDYQVVMAAVKQFGPALKYASERLRANRAIVVAAIWQKDRWHLASRANQYEFPIQFAAPQFQNDDCLLKELAKEDPLRLLRQMKKTSYGNKKDVVLTAMRNYIGKDPVIYDVSEELREDSDVFSMAAEMAMNTCVTSNLSAVVGLTRCSDDKDFMMNVLTHYGSFLIYASDTLKDDADLVLAAVQQSGTPLQFASERLRADVAIATAAVQKSGMALQFVPSQLQANRELVLSAVQNDGNALQFASATLQEDEEVAIMAMQSLRIRRDGWLAIATDKIRANRRVVRQAVRHYGYQLRYAAQELQDDKGIVMDAVRQDGTALLYASTRLQQDAEVVMVAVQQNAKALRHASGGCKLNFSINIAAVASAGSATDPALSCVPRLLLNDQEFVLALVRAKPRALARFFRRGWMGSMVGCADEREFVLQLISHLSPLFPLEYCDWFPLKRSDRSILLAAVQKRGLALEAASEQHKDDPSIVLRAVQNNGRALRCASARLQNDRNIVMAAVSSVRRPSDHRCLGYAHNEMRDNKEIVMIAVSHNGLELKFASRRLQQDRDVVLAAVESNPMALEHASEDLKADTEIVVRALKKEGRVLRFATERLRGDVDLVMMAISSTWTALRYAAESVRNDEGVVLAAISKNGVAMSFAGDSLKNDDSFVAKAVERDGIALSYTGDKLKRDPFLRRVAFDGRKLPSACGSCFSQDDGGEELALAITRSSWFSFDLMSRVPKRHLGDKGFMMKAVQRNGLAIRYARGGLQNDTEIVLAAVANDSHALGSASARLRDDKAVVMAAANSNRGLCLRHASFRLCANKDVVLAAMRCDGLSLRDASYELRADKDAALAALKQNKRAHGYIMGDAASDREVLIAAGLVEFSNHDIIVFAVNALQGRYIVP
ncbi:expressed unknown protein [Seminavis robusta]|uniref:DUF4116 domain-containing protein n=1 Tax=Seminavis robusta TaxID=568900 RepID=A0A9N8E2B8_9STRA|nr:expressed unknown protein [Seminavis robusta]|eukprot:Sro582_g170470.1 n/a (926) ;mRNA; r:20787-23564